MNDSDRITCSDSDVEAMMKQARSTRAFDRQVERSGMANAALDAGRLKSTCELDAPGWELLRRVSDRLRLSARAYHRIIKVARTVADLNDSDAIRPEHLSEAIGYRPVERLIS